MIASGLSPFYALSRFSALSLSLALSLAATATAGGDGDVYRLLVLHTNDMHSHFDQTDGAGARCARGDGDGGAACYGGFARLKTAVDGARARAAGRADGTLFLNAGDTFQGTPFYTYFRWPLVARMLRPLGIDVMCLGNHEFDNGVADVKSFIQNISIPIVVSNLDLTKEPSLLDEPNLTKSKVLTVNGRKIGIIGYLTPDTMYIASVGRVKILPEIPSIAAEAKRLKKEGVHILIALGHSGFATDRRIAKEVDDIDLVIGGHTNTFLYSGNAPDIEEPVGPYPFWVEQPKTHRKVPVVQAFYLTKYLGNLWLEFDKAGEVIKAYGNPILLGSQIKQDRKYLKLVKRYGKTIEAKMQIVIGKSSVFLEGNTRICRLRECNLGNFITDSFINYNLKKNFKSFDLTKYWTDAPIAIMQSGGIRMDINHITRNGIITFGDLLNTVPFEEDIGKITTKGSDIWAVFEFSVRRYNKDEAYGEFLQTSGLRVEIDLSRPSGRRVRSIYARCRNCMVPVYQKLDLNGDYTIILSYYLAHGGDGIEFEKMGKYQSLGSTDWDILMDELTVNSPIRPEVDRRIILLNEDEL